MHREKAMHAAYTRFLRAKRARLGGGDTAYQTLTADLLDILADSEDAHATVLAFAIARYRMDARSAAIHALTPMLGGEWPAEMDRMLMDFLLNRAGLGDHADRERIIALCEAVAQEYDWGLGLLTFAKGVVALSRDEEENE